MDGPFAFMYKLYALFTCPIHVSHDRWVEDDSLVDEGGSSFTNWYPGRPDGGDSENCMHMYYDDGTWNDNFCDHGIYVAVCSKRITTAAQGILHFFVKYQLGPQNITRDEYCGCVQGDHSACSQGCVYIKTKVAFQYMDLIIKRNL